jgi:hypothetical protein
MIFCVIYLSRSIVNMSIELNASSVYSLCLLYVILIWIIFLLGSWSYHILLCVLEIFALVIVLDFLLVFLCIFSVIFSDDRFTTATHKYRRSFVIDPVQHNSFFIYNCYILVNHNDRLLRFSTERFVLDPLYLYVPRLLYLFWEFINPQQQLTSLHLTLYNFLIAKYPAD